MTDLGLSPICFRKTRPDTLSYLLQSLNRLASVGSPILINSQRSCFTELKLHACRGQTTRVSLANYTCVVGQLNVYNGSCSQNFRLFVFPFFISGEKQTNKNKLWPQTFFARKQTFERVNISSPLRNDTVGGCLSSSHSKEGKMGAYCTPAMMFRTVTKSAISTWPSALTSASPATS